MKMIFVSGVAESGKDTLLDLALRGSKKFLPPYERVNLDEILEEFVERSDDGVWDVPNIDECKRLQKNLYQRLEEILIEKMRLERNIIVNGYFEVKTKPGYVPLLDERFFQKFRIDAIIFVSFKEEMSEITKTKVFGDSKGFEEAKRRQDMNRSLAVEYSGLSGALLKIIEVDLEDVKKTVKDMIDALGVCMR